MGYPPDRTLSPHPEAPRSCLHSRVTSTTEAAPATAQHRMRRPRRVLLSGVSSGLAAHLGWSPARVRLLFVAATALFGAGPLLYLWLWALTPLEPVAHDAPDVVQRRVPVAWLLVAAAMVAAALLLLTLRSDLRAQTTGALAALMLGAGGAVAWTLAFDRRDVGRSPRVATVIRALSAALLLLGGGLTLIAGQWGPELSQLNAVLAFSAVLLGAIVLLAPRLVQLWSDFEQSRAAQVRESHRAEVAAHLHDSVLQTLALIQNRAGASTEVARIARAQERELRDWLFGAEEPEAADVSSELRAVAAAIELELPVRIELVTVGAPPPRSSAALVAAAREAMLNAARHAGGEVSVYLESTAGSVDVFVRDRGPGVDIATIPADRIGIRESIIGRMSRAGGSASVRAGAGGLGTEVHLHLETGDD